MKKYFSWTGIILVAIYGLWVLNTYYEIQNCTGFLCELGILKTAMPGLLVFSPFGSMMGQALFAVAYIFNVIFYYSIGLLISTAFSKPKAN